MPDTDDIEEGNYNSGGTSSTEGDEIAVSHYSTANSEEGNNHGIDNELEVLYDNLLTETIREVSRTDVVEIEASTEEPLPPTLDRIEGGSRDVRSNRDNEIEVLAKLILNEMRVVSNSRFKRVHPSMSVKYHPEESDEIAVCIGPYYPRCCKHAYNIRRMKLRGLHYFMSRFIEDESRRYEVMKRWLLELKDLDVIEHMLSQKEFKTFGGEIMDNKEVLKMLLLDAFFIVVYLVINNFDSIEMSFYFREICHLENDWILRDLLKDKNQIPFQAVQHIWNWVKEKDFSAYEDFLDVFLSTYFNNTKKFEAYLFPVSDPIILRGDELGIRDLNHLYHSITVRGFDGDFWIPSATELEKSGIRLFRKTAIMSSFSDITYRNGMLEIPELNFIKTLHFLQTAVNTLSSDRMIQYCQFMHCLLPTPADVQLLVQKGIIMFTGNRSDDDIIQFFHSLAQGRKLRRPNYLSKVCKKLVNFRKARRNKWRVDFFRNYCSNPWVILSLLGGILILVLTTIGTAYTVASYYKQ